MDEYPPLTRNLFSLTASRYPIPGLYKEVVIHFGLTLKDVADDWDVWLDKFESFLEVFSWREARVHLELSRPVVGEVSAFSYRWAMLLSEPLAGNRIRWRFEGGPRELGEIVPRCLAFAETMRVKLRANPTDTSSLKGLMACLERLRQFDEYYECLLQLQAIDPESAGESALVSWADRQFG
jgi:hypothetical protein